MRILVDAMGGDNAPQEIVRGAMRAKRELGTDITLVGQREAILACLEEGEADSVRIVDAREVVTMEDDPSTATRRKKDSSMAVALLTTLYGSLIANWLTGPVSAKLSLDNDMEVTVRIVTIEGLLSIQAGENPHVIEEKLKQSLFIYTKKQLFLSLFEDQFLKIKCHIIKSVYQAFIVTL